MFTTFRENAVRCLCDYCSLAVYSFWLPFKWLLYVAWVQVVLSRDNPPLSFFFPLVHIHAYPLLPLSSLQFSDPHIISPPPLFFNVTGDKFGFLFLSMWRASMAKVGNTLDDQPYPTIIDDRARKQLFDSGYLRREAVSSPKQKGVLLMLTLSLAYQGFVCTMIIIIKKDLCFETGEQCPCMKSM